MAEVVGRVGDELEHMEQEEALGCFGATVAVAADLDQRSVNDILSQADLFSYDFGFVPVPAEEIDRVLEGVRVSEVLPIFDPFSGDETPLDTSASAVEARIEAIDQALRSGQEVSLFFPRQREGEEPFLHAVLITGFEISDDGEVVVSGVDTSEVDGSVFVESAYDFMARLVPQPEEGIPVFAYGISIE